MTNVIKKLCLFSILCVLLHSCSNKILSVLNQSNFKDSTYTINKNGNSLKTQEIKKSEIDVVQKNILWHPAFCYNASKFKVIPAINKPNVYVFLQAKIKLINQAINTTTYITPIVFEDSNDVAFISLNSEFYISTGKLLAYENSSELLSFMIHEIVHFLHQEKMIPFIKIDLPIQDICTDSNWLTKNKSIYFKMNTWKKKEMIADSITLCALLFIQHYPNSMMDKITKRKGFYSEECSYFKDERILKLNQNWSRLGMPSYFLHKKEYDTFKNLLK